MSKKSETLQEYLARGGKITICPTVEPKQDKIPARSTQVNTVATILTFEEADNLYGTKTERKKAKKTTNSKKLENLKKGIDGLPKHIKEKLGL